MRFMALLLLWTTSTLAAAGFPTDFKWCVATSAHQIEGNNSMSDWWAFEQQEGRIRHADVSGEASMHWNRLHEDVGLIKSLAATDYRMSVEWAKIEPVEGQIDQSVIAHYVQELSLLKAQGIRPIVTLHHFTFPKWLADKGGWEWAGATEAFERFTRTVYGFAAPYVSDWVTVNEPVIYALNGYVSGVFPPGQKREIGKVVPVFLGILKAHAASYHALHALASERGYKVRVGMAHSVRTFDPKNRLSPLDQYIAGRSDELWNWAIPNALESGKLKLNLLWMLNVDVEIPALKGTQDFVGINYYTGDLVEFSMEQGLKVHTRKGLPKNDMGWDIYPKGLKRILKKIQQRYPRHSILITENGIADASDAQRPQFLRDHLQVVREAINEGVKVEGYCHWSLLDNFEWAEGFEPRFGLFKVDYQSGERLRTESADVFTQFARGEF